MNPANARSISIQPHPIRIQDCIRPMIILRLTPKFKGFHWRILSYGVNIRFAEQQKKIPIGMNHLKILTGKFLLIIFSRVVWFKFSNRNAEYKKYIF